MNSSIWGIRITLYPPSETTAIKKNLVCQAGKKSNNDKKASSPFSGLKSSRKSSDSESDTEDANAPRIKSNLSANLKLLKYLKDTQKSQEPLKPSRYRRKKQDKTVEQEVPEPSTTENTWGLDDFHHRAFWRDNEGGVTVGPPVLLVDGYNVCGYWPKLKKNFARGFLGDARMDLLEELAAFGATRGVKVVCVFDARFTGLPTHHEEYHGVEVVFTTGLADHYIEKEVGVLKEKRCPRVWVATSDRQEANYAWAKGAFVWSCSYLVREIKAAKRELQEKIDKANPDKYSFKGKLLEHNLNKETRDALLDLRKQLIQKEGQP